MNKFPFVFLLSVFSLLNVQVTKHGQKNMEIIDGLEETNKMKKLILPTLQTFAIGVVAGTLLFLPAWTLSYRQAWLFIVVFLVAVNGIGVYLSLYDPELLERRKKFGPASEGNHPPRRSS